MLRSVCFFLQYTVASSDIVLGYALPASTPNTGTYVVLQHGNRHPHLKAPELLWYPIPSLSLYLSVWHCYPVKSFGSIQILNYTYIHASRLFRRTFVLSIFESCCAHHVLHSVLRISDGRKSGIVLRNTRRPNLAPLFDPIDALDHRHI